MQNSTLLRAKMLSLSFTFPFALRLLGMQPIMPQQATTGEYSKGLSQPVSDSTTAFCTSAYRKSETGRAAVSDPMNGEQLTSSKTSTCLIGTELNSFARCEDNLQSLPAGAAFAFWLLLFYGGPSELLSQRWQSGQSLLIVICSAATGIAAPHTHI